MKEKLKYYSLKPILQKNARYNVIFGHRSNGKTYAALEYGLTHYIKEGSELAIIRRWQDDFKGKRSQQMFDALVDNCVISKLTKGEWTDVHYYGNRWFLCRYDEDHHRIVSDTPFAYAFALTSMEHDKSTSYPSIRTVVFDEFLTRPTAGGYLVDEFVSFMNTLSTIIRQRDDVRIFMLGNTISTYCPYFTEMGLKHVKQMKHGDIDVYTYGSSGLTVAVEYCSPNENGKPSDVYFAFDNPKLNMIRGSQEGAWELGVYPHMPEGVKVRPRDIIFSYFIQFDGELMQADIIHVDQMYFTFIHRKTTELQHPDKDIIYSQEWDPRPNWRRRMTKPIDDIDRKVASFFIKDKVYYQDNEVGEIVTNYLGWSKKLS